jgi:hypothetical protein
MIQRFLVDTKELEDEGDCLLGCSAVSEVLAVSIIRAIARTSETLVNFYQTTRRYSPEDSSHLQEDKVAMFTHL